MLTAKRHEVSKTEADKGKAVQRNSEEISPSPINPLWHQFATSVPGVQAKLKIGQPGDKDEQEADRVAEQVMRMPEPQVQRQVVPGLKRDEDTLQAKSADGNGSAFLQATSYPLIQNVLSSSGQPLDMATRSFMEPRFRQDFSRVRVHTDGQAAESARAVNARAYTVGRNVVFEEGQYAPGSSDGRKLMAHELVHVGQQACRTSEQSVVPRSIVSSQPTLMRDLSEHEKSAITAEANSLIEESLLGEGTPRDEGPIDEPEAIAKARANLDTFRQILDEVHTNVNSVLIMLQNLEEMNLPEVFTLDLLLSIVYEALDAVGVAVSEELEAAVTIVAKTIKVVAQATERYYKTKAKNEDLLARNVTISFLLDQFVMAKGQIDLLKSTVQFRPQLAYALANLKQPQLPGRVATKISGNIEFELIRSLIKRKGGKLALRTTDGLSIKKTVDYKNTEHAKKAISRSNDPLDNWYLYGAHQCNTLLFHPTADYGCSWRVLIVEGVAEEVVTHALRRMNSTGVPKAKLYDLRGKNALPMNPKLEGTLFQVDVIE